MHIKKVKEEVKRMKKRGSRKMSNATDDLPEFFKVYTSSLSSQMMSREFHQILSPNLLGIFRQRARWKGHRLHLGKLMSAK